MNKKFYLSFVLIAVSLGGCTANEINAGIGIATNVLQGTTISNDQLAEKARLSARAMDQKYGVADASNAYTQRLNRLTQGLRNYDGLNLNFSVYQSNQINAFAMPDGTVRVFTGLMDMMDDDELLAVIGHEIGHVKNQHALRQYRKAYLARAATTGLVAYGGSTVSQLASSYGNIGLAAMGAQFSQRDELESDAYGVNFLHQLGRNPYAAVTAQEKLMAKAGGGGGFFSSHPASQRRIVLVKARADAVSKR